MAKVALFLDRRKNTGIDAPLVIRITNKATIAHIPLNIRLRNEQWDNGTVVKHPQEKMLNRIINQKFLEFKLKLADISARTSIRNLSAKEIKELVLEEKKELRDTKFSEYYEKYIERYQKQSTIEVYTYTYNKVEKFCNIKNLLISDINNRFIRDFTAFLEKTCSTNTVSIHLRNLRAIINAAIDDEILRQDDYPFRRIRIKKSATAKRSLTAKDIARIATMKVKPTQEKYRDIFMLSFYLAGINMIDLLHAKEIINGRIEFVRNKTNIPCSLIVPQEAVKIINKYRGKNQLLYVLDNYNNHKDFIHRLNLNLQSIKDDNGRKLYPSLTSYWARHTWATIAADIDIPDAIIDMALGHKSPYPMSDIYIRRNLKKVDKAIFAVIDKINEYK